MNSSILFEANKIERRFKKDQLSCTKKLPRSPITAAAAAQNGLEIALICDKIDGTNRSLHRLIWLGASYNVCCTNGPAGF